MKLYRVCDVCLVITQESRAPLIVWQFEDYIALQHHIKENKASK